MQPTNAVCPGTVGSNVIILLLLEMSDYSDSDFDIPPPPSQTVTPYRFEPVRHDSKAANVEDYDQDLGLFFDRLARVDLIMQ